MIKKILKIEGLGKFKNFNSANANLTFEKNTIIFGYNTYGKSTLTTIFRSLKDSDQRHLQGRKNFEHTDDIVIDILDGDNQHLTLVKGNWNNPNIAIFDSHFIHQSVFVGDEIKPEHQSSLHGVFVGEDIVKKADLLQRLRAEQHDLEKVRDEVKAKYTKNDLGTFDGFLQVQEIENVNQEIKNKETEIKKLINISNLKQLISDSPLSHTFDTFFTVMQETLDESAESNIDKHVRNHWNNEHASKNFLADGVNLLKNEIDTCVFCGQNLAPVTELVRDFKKVFGITYKETREKIEKYGERFLHLDVEAEMVKFRSLGVECGDILDIKALLENKKILDDDIKLKLKNLNHSINGSESSPLNIFISEVKKLHPIFDKLKNQEFSATEKRDLENELKQLKLSQYRYSRDGVSFNREYKESLAVIEAKKMEIKTLREEIDRDTEKAIGDNREQVNTILRDTLKANFIIEELSSQSNLTRSEPYFVNYKFVMDGNTVPISNKRSQSDEEPLDKRYFGNTFSESDKKLLALAFFISSLQTDQNLKDKIVILDDPFSSFDTNKKGYLAQAIVDIENNNDEQPKQLIILTHDDSFLVRLREKFSTPDTNILNIKHSDVAGSVLEKCDIDEIIKEEYFKNIKYIKDSIDNSHKVDEALKKVRPCLERILRSKYYLSLDKKTLEEGSINTYLEKIGAKCEVKSDILNGNWHESMHDQPEIMELSEPEKIQKLKDFLLLLEKV